MPLGYSSPQMKVPGAGNDYQAREFTICMSILTEQASALLPMLVNAI